MPLLPVAQPDEPFADVPARGIPPRDARRQLGLGTCIRFSPGEQALWLPSTRNWFAQCWEELEACAEFPEGRDGPIHKKSSWVPERWEIPSPGAFCFPVGLGQGRMFHMHRDQCPQPNLAQESLGIKGTGKGT